MKMLAAAEDEAAAIDALRHAAAQLHAQSACFITSVLDAAPDGWTHRMLAACDAGWASRYQDEHLYRHDPWLRHARESADPVIASTLPVAPEEAAYVRAAWEAGMRSVWIVPAHSPFATQWTGVLYLASETEGFYERQPELADDVRVFAWSLALHLQQWMRTRLKSERFPATRLTPNDVELLRHEAMGHGSKEIAAFLGIEAKTIDCRFQRVNAKLGVPTRREALRVAKLFGVI